MLATAISFLQLFNIGAPVLVSLIATVRNPDGTTSTVDLLNQADAQFTEVQAKVQDWKKAHPGM